MTADDYRDALARLDLSQVRAARLFGVDERTSRRWALGEVPIPKLVERTIRMLLSGALLIEDLEDSAES